MLRSAVASRFGSWTCPLNPTHRLFSFRGRPHESSHREIEVQTPHEIKEPGTVFLRRASKSPIALLLGETGWGKCRSYLVVEEVKCEVCRTLSRDFLLLSLFPWAPSVRDHNHI